MILNQQCPQTPVDLPLVHASSTEHKFEWYSSPMPLPSIVYLPSTNTHNLKVKTQNQTSVIKLRKKNQVNHWNKKEKKWKEQKKEATGLFLFQLAIEAWHFALN